MVFKKEQSPFSGWSFMMANFATQYNFGSMAIALIAMSSTLCTTEQEDCDHGKQAAWVTGTSNAIMLVGAIAGQLGMGKMGDLLGRNNAFLATMTLATFGSLLSATAPSGPAHHVYGGIIGCRFILGLGLGGVYPLSATKASEDSGSDDGNIVNSVAAAWAFFWQMPGVMGPYALAYFIARGNELTVDATWRLILGFGAVPAGIAMVLLILEKIWLYENPQGSRETMSPALNIDNVRVTSRRATTDPNFANVVQDNMQIKGESQPHLPLRQSSPGNSLDDGADDVVAGIEEGSGGAGLKDHVPSSSTDDITGGRASGAVRSSRSITTNTSGVARTSIISALTEDTQAAMDEKGKRVYSSDGRGPTTTTRSSVVRKLQEEYAQDPYLINRFLVSGVTWFLFDVVVYGLGLFGPEIIYAIDSDDSSNISSSKSMQHLTSNMLLVQSMALPSTALGIYLLPHLSLRTMQTSGFVLVSLVCLIFGAIFNSLRVTDPSALYALFVIVGFFMQFLVNVTTFVMPAAVFRKEVRASFNGISAAMGKVGAVVGAFAFPAIGQSGSSGVVVIMILCCVAGIAGAAITWFYLNPEMVNDGDNSGRPIHYPNNSDGTTTRSSRSSTKSSGVHTGGARAASEMELSKPHNVIHEHPHRSIDGDAGGRVINPIRD